MSSTSTGGNLTCSTVISSAVLETGLGQGQRFTVLLQAGLDDLADEDRVVATRDRVRNLALEVAESVLEHRQAVGAVAELDFAELVVRRFDVLEEGAGQRHLPGLEHVDAEHTALGDHVGR